MNIIWSSLRRTFFFALLLLLLGASVDSQTAKSPFAPVPPDQRAALRQRLLAYTEAFREKDWSSLYDLVSDRNKISLDKPKVTRRVFVRDMQGTYDLQRLIRFVAVRTAGDGTEAFDIYGCGKLPYGDETIERIAAVQAVREHGNWYFTNWDYADPPEPCSNLSDPTWKARNLRIGEPMLQVSCELFVCTL